LFTQVAIRFKCRSHADPHELGRDEPYRLFLLWELYYRGKGKFDMAVKLNLCPLMVFSSESQFVVGDKVLEACVVDAGFIQIGLFSPGQVMSFFLISVLFTGIMFQVSNAAGAGMQVDYSHGHMM
jgi:hypothetical protein